MTNNTTNNTQRTQPPLLYTVPELAKLLHVNPNVVRQLCHAGLIRPLKLGVTKVTAREVERFLADNTGKDLTDPFNVKDIG